MKKSLYVFIVLLLLTIPVVVTGCMSEDYDGKLFEAEARSESIQLISASFEYMTFEEALAFATDVVIAQYVGSRPFGESLMEFEFIVSERILGNAADRIFVYTESNIRANVFGSPQPVTYMPGELTFTVGTYYILPLGAIGSPYAKTHDDGFVFIRNIVINLDNPSESGMYSESLARHSTNLDFDRQLARSEITSFVADLTRSNSPGEDFIRSSEIEDIIDGSPYVLVIEINEPRRLVSQQATTDWMETDLFYITVIRSLKGELTIEFNVMTFFANTVQTGEQHIVAAKPIEEGHNWLDFTSRNSLFRMDQLNEIMRILGLYYEGEQEQSDVVEFEDEEAYEGYDESNNENGS